MPRSSSRNSRPRTRRRGRDRHDSDSDSSESNSSYSSRSYSSRSRSSSGSSYDSRNSHGEDGSYSSRSRERATRSKRGRRGKSKNRGRRDSDDDRSDSSSKSSSSSSRSRGNRRRRNKKSADSYYSDTSSSNDNEGAGTHLDGSDGDLSRALHSLVGELKHDDGHVNVGNDTAEASSSSDDTQSIDQIDLAASLSRFQHSDSNMGRSARRAFKGSSSNPDILVAMSGKRLAPVQAMRTGPGLMRSFSGRQQGISANPLVSSSMHGGRPAMMTNTPALGRTHSARGINQQWGNTSLDLSTGSAQIAGKQGGIDLSFRSQPSVRNRGLDDRSVGSRSRQNNSLIPNGSFRMKPVHQMSQQALGGSWHGGPVPPGARANTKNQMMGVPLNLSSHGVRPQASNMAIMNNSAHGRMMMMMNNSAHGRMMDNSSHGRPLHQPNAILSRSSHGVVPNNDRLNQDRRQNFQRQSSDDALIKLRRQKQIAMQQDRSGSDRDDSSSGSSSRSSRSDGYSSRSNSRSSGSGKAFDYYTDLQQGKSKTRERKRADENWIKKNIQSRSVYSNDPPGEDSNANFSFDKDMSSDESSYDTFGADVESQTGSYADPPPDAADGSDVESQYEVGSRNGSDPPDSSDGSLHGDEQDCKETALRKKSSNEMIYAMVTDLQNQLATRYDNFVTSEQAMLAESRMISKMNELQVCLVDREHTLDLSEEELKDITSQLGALRLQIQNLEQEKSTMAEGVDAELPVTGRKYNGDPDADITADRKPKSTKNDEASLKSPQSPGAGWLAKQIKQRSTHGSSVESDRMCRTRQTLRKEPSAGRIDELQTSNQGGSLEPDQAATRNEKVLQNDHGLHSLNDHIQHENSVKEYSMYHDEGTTLSGSSGSSDLDIDSKKKAKKRNKSSRSKRTKKESRPRKKSKDRSGRESDSAKEEKRRSKLSKDEKKKKSKKDKKKSHDKERKKEKSSIDGKKYSRSCSSHHSGSFSSRGLSDESNDDNYRRSSNRKSKKSKKEKKTDNMDVSDHSSKGSKSKHRSAKADRRSRDDDSSSSTHHKRRKKKSERDNRKSSSSSKHRKTRDDDKRRTENKNDTRKRDKVSGSTSSGTTRTTGDIINTTYRFENDDVVGLISRLSAHVSKY